MNKKICVLLIMLLLLTFLTGCVKNTRILDVKLDSDKIIQGDRVKMTVDIINDVDISFAPKFDMIYSKDCFNDFYTSSTYPYIGSHVSKVYELSLDSQRYVNSCIGIQNVTIELIDSNTDKLIDTHLIQMNITAR